MHLFMFKNAFLKKINMACVQSSVMIQVTLLSYKSKRHSPYSLPCRYTPTLNLTGVHSIISEIKYPDGHTHTHVTSPQCIHFKHCAYKNIKYDILHIMNHPYHSVVQHVASSVSIPCVSAQCLQCHKHRTLLLEPAQNAK